MKAETFIAEIPCVIVYKDSCKTSTTKDTVITEERIALYLNGKKIISTMSIPIDQDAHAVGFLLSEGVIEKIEDITNIFISDDGLSVFIDSKINEENISNLYHEKTLTSGCCVGVTGNFEGKIIEKFISSHMKVSLKRIWKLLEEFDSNNELFKLTGCVHQAILALENNECVISQDVGRHNAIDKVVGKAKLSGLDTSTAILLVSGRLSMEMIIKAAMHDIPIIISRAASTQLGIKTAQMLGITLIGFARNDKLNIYTHPARIALE
ncbi:formate dehydrogenase accessory sulfurtransferase FdhD [Helicobacter cappadocius]|uniref:Sulfur carrier protein FdhD n=1 Tax=Helicobacter cappadocius TaxID=3063998 RepID=A0AA90PQI5_9HELI|nr:MULTISPECIES: formate dehydrogenase accessory sulfurtransferase FdhD [unclassified Helicobacter]MDO7252888.1 formate dehydrogenase accessory sulfurtransferase FdhD [Helicobacter sp. faydin-H75]MDP2538931.1 formate dehydrogenase accessory sulfurtransferase FdhD [Helicobacter sp. faydin-H76]